MGKARRVEQFFDERRALGVQLTGVPGGGFQRLAKIVCGGLVSEEQAQKSLDFDNRRGGLADETTPSEPHAPSG